MTSNHGTGMKLTELLARVKAATGPDREIDIDLVAAFVSRSEAEYHRQYSLRIYEYTASIDAALALVERMLPGWTWMLESTTEKSMVLWKPKAIRATANEYSATLPLAILAALLSVLAQIEGTKG